MSVYSEFFLNSSSAVVELELLEISHPSFTQIYRIVRNAVAGVTVTLEDNTSQTFNYYPLRIKATKDSDNLDQVLKIDLGDLGAILPTELDGVNSANNFQVKPTLVYRTYRSDDLSKPLLGPLRFEISNLAFNGTGVSFEASAPKLNTLATGEIYTFDRFPMLRGFV